MGFANFLAMSTVSIPFAGAADELGTACCANAKLDKKLVRNTAKKVFVFFKISQESKLEGNRKLRALHGGLLQYTAGFHIVVQGTIAQ